MRNDGLNLFNEIDNHLLEDSRPSEYLRSLEKKEIFMNEYPFTMLSRLQKVDQSPKHHPEGNVWNHTMLVLDNAAQVKAQSSDRRVFMWASLLHDIGKAVTTRIRNGRITSYDHDIEGEKLARAFLGCFSEEKEFINKVCSLVRWHMQILFVTNKLPFADIDKMKSQADIKEVGLLGLCDRLGRKKEQDVQKEIETMENFIEVCTRG
jgi:putative nucleotidyltransferase with HDIG domain